MENLEKLKEESADKQKDIEAISSVIQTYVEGGRKGDASIMKHAFRETPRSTGILLAVCLLDQFNSCLILSPQTHPLQILRQRLLILI